MSSIYGKDPGERPLGALWLTDILKLPKPTTLYGVRNVGPGSNIYKFMYDEESDILETESGYLRVKNPEPEQVRFTDWWDFNVEAYNLIDMSDKPNKWKCYIFEDYWYAVAFMGWCNA